MSRDVKHVSNRRTDKKEKTTAVITVSHLLVSLVNECRIKKKKDGNAFVYKVKPGIFSMPCHHN